MRSLIACLWLLLDACADRCGDVSENPDVGDGIPRGHARANEKIKELVGPPRILLAVAHENQFASHVLKQLTLYRCHHSLMDPDRVTEVNNRILDSALYADRVFNARIRSLMCAEVELDDGNWYKYSFQDKMWKQSE